MTLQQLPCKIKVIGHHYPIWLREVRHCTNQFRPFVSIVSYPHVLIGKILQLFMISPYFISHTHTFHLLLNIRILYRPHS